MKITKRQAQALEAAFKKNGAWYANRGSLMGGAYRRLCLHLVELNLVNEKPPYSITVTGLVVLRDRWAKRYAAHPCMAYQDDLKEVEAAIAEVPLMAKRAAEKLGL